MLAGVKVPLYENSVFYVGRIKVLSGLPVEVVVFNHYMPCFWPVEEVGWQDMLIGEVKQADRPFLVITLEEVMRII
jgi:hypothetical protein